MDIQCKASLEIKTLSNLIKRYARKELDEKNDNELTPVQMGVLMFLNTYKERDVFQRDIEEEFSIRASTASNILQKMESKHLIVRQSVPYDARLKKIDLTPDALDLRERVSSLFMHLEKKLLEEIKEEEMDTFFLVIDKMKENIKERE